jgi:uncharacterized protein (DUF2141 family)
MKKTIIISALMLMSVALCAQHRLTIKVDGITKVKGQLMVAVYDEDNFLRKPVAGTIVKVDSQQMTVVIDSLSAGIYAISAFQDENDNGKLDANAFGMPVEPYAFSNNAKGEYGPPKFKDCAFKVEEDTSITILLE